MIEYNVITWMSGGYSWRREQAPTIAGTLIESTQKSVVLATGLLFKRYKFLLLRALQAAPTARPRALQVDLRAS